MATPCAITETLFIDISALNDTAFLVVSLRRGLFSGFHDPMVDSAEGEAGGDEGGDIDVETSIVSEEFKVDMLESRFDCCIRGLK